jgi:hypothetical protein
MKLKDITKEEAELFIGKLDLQTRDNYSYEQACLIAEEVEADERMFVLIDGLMRDEKIDAVSKIYSLFVAAFQIGRQFELSSIMNSIRKETNDDKIENS